MISNLSITPAFALVGEGGGSIDADVTFDYRAKDGTKIALVFYRLIDADGTRFVDEVIEEELKRSGSFGFALTVPTGSAKTLTLRVRIVDSCLSNSKWANLEFPVQAVASVSDRTEYAVVRLAGHVYLVGGREASGDASDALLQYDPATGITAKKARLPEGRYSSAAASYGNNIFVFGGTAHGYAQDAVFVYDPIIDRWMARSPMPVPIGSGNAYQSIGFIYVSGSGRIIRYNPEVDTWQQTGMRSGSE